MDFILLLSPKSTVILRLLQLAALLGHLLVLLVQPLPLGLHLFQLGGETVQLLGLALSLRSVDHLQLLTAVVLRLLAEGGGGARLALLLHPGLEGGELDDLLSELRELLVPADSLGALGDAAQLLEYPALNELLLVEELLRLVFSMLLSIRKIRM